MNHICDCNEDSKSSCLILRKKLTNKIIELTKKLEIERVKTSIYKQIVEQKIGVTIIDNNKIRTNNHLKFDKKDEFENHYKQDEEFDNDDKMNTNEDKFEDKPNKDEIYDIIDADIKSEPDEFIEIKEPSNEDTKLNIVKLIDNLFELVKTKTQYTYNVKNIRVERLKMMNLVKLDEYTDLIKEHLKQLNTILKGKLVKSAKIKNIIHDDFLSPLEQRLIGNESYYKVDLEYDEIETFQQCMIKQNYRIDKLFNMQSIINTFINYGLALYPISKNINQILFNSSVNNLIYVPFTSDEVETVTSFSFYTLKNTTLNKFSWSMDCNLEHLTHQLVSPLSNYINTLFRKIYYDIFNHNTYKDDYNKFTKSAENELEQLIQNLICINNYKMFNVFLKNVIIKYKTYNPTSMDNFDTKKEQVADNIKSENILSNVIRELFDEITNEQISTLISKHSINLLSHKY